MSLTSKTSHHRNSLSQGSPQADSQWKDQQDLHRTISTFQSLKALILKFPTEIQQATPALKNQGQFTFSFTLSSHMQEWSKFRATPFTNEFYFPFSRGGLWSDIKSIKLFMDKKKIFASFSIISPCAHRILENVQVQISLFFVFTEVHRKASEVIEQWEYKASHTK